MPDTSSPPMLLGSRGLVEHNRVRVWQDIRYDYDSHGRLIAKHAGRRQSTQLAWNSEHQLTHAHIQKSGQSSQTWLYHHDALGRRSASRVGDLSPTQLSKQHARRI